jgi:hypothetical protein
MTPSPEAKSQDKLLQTGRMMWIFFLIAGCGFFALSRVIHNTQPGPAPSRVFVWAIAAVGVADVVILGLIRRSLLAKSGQQSAQNQAVTARQTWLSAQMLGFASAMSIVLFGFLLHTLGVRPAWIPVAFFIAGLLIIAAYRPRFAASR